MEEVLIQWNGTAVNGSDENTSTAISLFREAKTPFVGYPGLKFQSFFIFSSFSLTTSCFVSLTLITFLCGCCRWKSCKTKTIKEQSGSRKQKSDGTAGDSDRHTKGISSISSSGAIVQKEKPAPSNTRRHIRDFWKWNVGERFVLYIAACDVGYGSSHSIDLYYIDHFQAYPPDLLCAFLGFLLHLFMVGQWFVITICAVSACSLVVFGKKLSLGRWDWRVFAFAFVFPMVVGIFGIIYRSFGETGDWCYVNIKTVAGQHYNLVMSIFGIVLYGVVAVAYVSIWFKIRRTTGLMEGSSTTRYQNSARMMLIFVAVFLVQWSPYVVYNVWSLIATPPPEYVIVGGLVANLGGVYNCFAYTIIRRRLQKQAKESGANVVVSDDRKAKHNALDRTPTTSATSVSMKDTTTEAADSSKQNQAI